MRAAAEAAVDLTIIIDNKSVQSALQTIFSGGSFLLPRYGFGRWAEILQLIQGRSHRTYWLPSHGKRYDWQPPPSSGGDADTWRRLNDVADARSTWGLEKSNKYFQAARIKRQCSEGESWAKANLERLRNMSGWYIREHDSDGKAADSFCHGRRGPCLVE